MMHTARISPGISFAAVVSLTIGLNSAAFACCANYAEFAAACRAQGGVPAFGAVCNPSSGGGSSVGGLSSNQQLMMGLAGALGAAFGEMLRGQSADDARARQRAMEQEAIAMAEFRALEQDRMRRLEERHRLLLASLKGGIHNSELGLKRGSDTGTLTLKTGDTSFGVDSRKTVTLALGDKTGSGNLPSVDAPAVPEGKPVDFDIVKKLTTDYQRAADDFAIADLKRQQLEKEKALAEQVRAEAEKNYKEQQALTAPGPQDQAVAGAPFEDDKLAEAEKLLEQAISLDEQARQDLENARQDVERAKREVDRADSERAKAEQSLASVEPPSPK